MTRTATAERSTSDESSSLASDAATHSSEPEFSIETSVMPPAYLPASTTLESSEPNVASVASAASADSASLSHDVCEMSAASDAANDESEDSESVSDAETATEDEESESAEAGEEESDEESDSEESGAEGESEEAEEDEEESEEESGEEAEGATAEGAEAEAGAEGAETDHGVVDVAEPAPASLPNGDEEEFESIEVLTAKLPRMHPIRPPYVGNAPAQAIERRDEIIKRTGSPPDLHHARIRQAAEQVTQAARDAQRRMIIALGRIGRDSRLSIEDMANQIALATASAVAQINRAIETAKTDIDTAATTRKNSLNDRRMLVGEELERHRIDVTNRVATDLRRGSDEVQQLDTAAQAEFTTYVASAKTEINLVPTQGKVGRIPDPPLPPGASPRKPPPPPEPHDYSIIGDTITPIHEFVDTESTALKDGPSSELYYRNRANATGDGLRERTQRQLVKAAQKKADDLDSPATRAEYLIGLLGLTTPVSEHHVRDKSHDETEAERAVRESHTEAENACLRAQNTLTQKSKLAIEYVDRDLRDDLTKNLWKAGRKAEKSFRKQAHAAEVAQNNNAATLAEAYRTLVKRLDAMLPQGQFLDSRRLLPRMLKERDSAFNLQRQHEQLAKQQADATTAQMDKSKRDQIDGLQKSVAQGREGINNTVLRTCFDMDLFINQVTNGLVSGVDAVANGAHRYAEDTARSINQSIHGTGSRGILQIQNAAVGFINGQISATEDMQYARLDAFVDAMKEHGEAGPLAAPMLEARGDFERRANNLHNAMPERSLLGGLASAVVGGGLLGPVGAVAAVGVYLYETDPSENTVIQNLGDVAYPGTPAIGEVFEHRKHYGNLQGRIRDRLSNPEKQDALDLFSDSPRTRGDSRRRIAEGSLGLIHGESWFGYSREAREAALSGMSAEESVAMDPAAVDATRRLIEDRLDQNQADVSVAFLEHNRERAVAAMTRRALDEGTRSASWGWIFSAQDSQRQSDRARVDAIARLDTELRRVMAIENSFAAVMTNEDVIPDPLNPGHNMTLRESREHVYQEFDYLTNPTIRNASSDRNAARRIDAASARRSVTSYATSNYTALRITPMAVASTALLATPLAPLGAFGLGAGIGEGLTDVSMSDSARNYIDAMINDDPTNDPEGNRVRSLRGIYEVGRAEEEGGRLSETAQITISEAVENRTLARYLRDAEDPNRTREERSRARRLADAELVHHRERMRQMAVGLGAPTNISGEAAVTFMANRVGNLFENSGTAGYNFTGMLADASGSMANMQSFGLFNAFGGSDFLHSAARGGGHRRYGEEMITRGRASLDASVALATDGIGTNDDLLRRSYVDRSQTEIGTANARWAKEHGGENMEEMLGIRSRSWDLTDYAMFAASPATWFVMRGSETSGDLAMELELLAQGNPENDMDRLRLADMRQRQEQRGTGWLGRLTMSGSTEESNMGGSRDVLATAVLARLRITNPELADRYANSPRDIIGPDGRIIESIRSLTFDARGNFLGDRTVFAGNVNSMRSAAEAYRARIDRIESALTTFITVGAIIASIALMLIPGVNVVAAGIAVALIAGAATIAVKMGMRGERYGWEEMATDIATTAIEAATAGISGGIAGGFKAGPFARLANVGKLLESGFGRIGGAIVREAVVNAVSSAASTAIQDDIWKDGFGKGLQRVANGAIRGAVVGAISTGLSEGISQGMSRRMSAAASEAGDKLSGWQRLAARLGPHGSEMLREAISNGVGAAASEAVGLSIDYAQGNFHGSFGDALKRIGLATFRETVTGGLRGGITSMHKAQYRQLLEAAHANPNLSQAQLHALRLFGISAGVLNYDTSIKQLHAEIGEAHNLLNRLPSALREQARQLDLQSLRGLEDMIESGDVAHLVKNSKEAQQHLQFMRDLESSVPDIDIQKLMKAVDASIDSHRAIKDQQAVAPEQQQAIRARLGSQMNEELKFALDRVPVDGLQHLSESELQQAAAMIASGRYSREQADALFRAVKARNPDVDEFQFLSHLNRAVEQSADVQIAANKAAAVRRQQLVDLVPDEAVHIFAGLPDAEAKLAHQLIHGGVEGTPHQQDAIFRAAQAKNPELTREQFNQFVNQATTQARTRMQTEATTKRAQREQNMTHVPEELRSTLSVLPESGLVELHLRQMEGSISPAEKNRLIAIAQKATPDVDVMRLSAAIDQAIATPPKQRVSDAEAAAMRQHLLKGVPEELRATVERTPILVLSDAEFAALTRSAKGQAATLIINGKPVVIVREGAQPHVMREEGIHVLQAKNPKWEEHIRALEEHQLADWDKLPLEQQVALYRNKVELELDAHRQLISSLESEIHHARSPQEKQALQRQLDLAQRTHENLSRRFSEVSSLDHTDFASIRAGFSERPQWLDQPARLFSKEDPKRSIDAEQLLAHEQTIERSFSKAQQRQLGELEPSQRQRVVSALAELSARGQFDPRIVKSLSRESFAAIVEAAPILLKHADGIDGIHGVLTLLNFVRTLQAGIPDKVLRAQLLADIAQSSGEQLHAILPSADIIVQLAKVNQGTPLAGDQARKFIDGLRRLTGVPLADLHIHTTSLVNATDIAQWIGSKLGDMNKTGANALYKALATLTVKGADLSNLKTSLQEWHTALQKNSPEHVLFRAQFEMELQKLVAMTIQQGQSEHKLKEFFAQFPRLKDFVSASGVEQLRSLMETAIERSLKQNVGWLELRGQHTSLLEGSDTIQKMLLAVGGVIATVARGKLGTDSFRTALERAVEKRLFLGFDISGQENGTLRGRIQGVVKMADVVAQHNRSKLDEFMSRQNLAHAVSDDVAGNHLAKQQLDQLVHELGIATTRKVQGVETPIPSAELHALVLARLKSDLSTAQQRLSQARKGETKALRADELLTAVGRMNRFNKMTIEALQRLNAIPHPGSKGATDVLDLVGLTIHAGEQVARTVKGNTPVLARLMDDIDIATRAGTDRIGHGVILGLSFDAQDLAHTMQNVLKFERVPASSRTGEAGWRRGGEFYTDSQLAHLETRRKAALQRIAHQGITLEVPPTSNIILNNLGLQTHPLLRMMQDVTPPPVLRVSVATDNPGIHHINVHNELALLVSMGVSWPEAVRIAVEGFASRMGARPVLAQGGELDVRVRMVEALLRTTPLSEAAAVLQELQLRFPHLAPVPTMITDQATFRMWLERFIAAAMGKVG